MLPFFEELEHAVKDAYDNAGVRLHHWPLFFAGVVVLFIAEILFPSIVAVAISIALFTSPVWLPVLVIAAAARFWLVLKQSEFIAKQENIVLEIKPPRVFDKTPLAMEAVLDGFHIGAGANWYGAYFEGKVRPWWSLEIASLEGKVHFYIWTRASFRRLIEAQVYSQYPGAQVVEVPDYTRVISGNPEEWSIWGCDYKETKPDPYPIKTYVEYGLDKVQKENEQVDPLSNLIEFAGSIGKGEYLWIQLLIRAHKGDQYAGKKNKAGGQYTWRDQAQELVQKMREETRSSYFDQATGKEVPGFPNPTKGQTETMAAIERNVSKPAFDIGIRTVYLTSGPFNLPMVHGMVNMFRQFSSEGWNALKTTRWLAEFKDYPWEYLIDKRKQFYRKHLVEAYRRRSYFFPPYKTEPMVMSTEEIATLFHIPSAAVTAPALARIISSTGEAPPNLPT